MKRQLYPQVLKRKLNFIIWWLSLMYVTVRIKLTQSSWAGTGTELGKNIWVNSPYFFNKAIFFLLVWNMGYSCTVLRIICYVPVYDYESSWLSKLVRKVKLNIKLFVKSFITSFTLKVIMPYNLVKRKLHMLYFSWKAEMQLK